MKYSDCIFLGSVGTRGQMHACAEYGGIRYYLGSRPTYYGCIEIIREHKPQFPDAFFFGTGCDYIVGGDLEALRQAYNG